MNGAQKKQATVDWSACRRLLVEGLAELGLRVGNIAVKRLTRYLQELATWNNTYNLTAVREPQEMVIKHVLDSLSAAPYVHGRRVIDVGSGAGLPGIPLAIVQPAKRVVLLDSNGKRCAFLRHVLRELKLDNATVVQSRVEQYSKAASFDTVIARALATVPELLELAGHLCARDGRILAMKGKLPKQELAALPPGFRVHAQVELTVPKLNAERHLIVLAPGLI